MPRTPIPVREEIQKIVDELLTEDYPFEPEQPYVYFLSNVITRVFAHLHARSTTGVKKLVCTEAGVLKTAPTGTGFEYNDVWSGSAPDAYGTAKTFDSVASRVDVFTWDNSAIIKRSLDGTVYQDEIEVPANFYYSFDGSTHSINIKNKTAGAVARFQIIGWW